MFIQTSASSLCGIRDAFDPIGRDNCPRHTTVDGAAISNEIRELASPNLRFLDLGNATREREMERMGLDAAAHIREFRSGDLNNNYAKHHNELYKAHQHLRPARIFPLMESRRRRGRDVDVLRRRRRGDAANATRIVRGDASRRRRECDVDSPRRRVAAATCEFVRSRRGSSVERLAP